MRIKMKFKKGQYVIIKYAGWNSKIKKGYKYKIYDIISLGTHYYLLRLEYCYYANGIAGLWWIDSRDVVPCSTYPFIDEEN